MAIHDKAGRVAIQQAIGKTADDTEAEYGLLDDAERMNRLIVAVDDIAIAAYSTGLDPQCDALVQLAAEAQLWAEALQAGVRQ